MTTFAHALSLLLVGLVCALLTLNYVRRVNVRGLYGTEARVDLLTTAIVKGAGVVGALLCFVLLVRLFAAALAGES
jgi:hypothetical protein